MDPFSWTCPHCRTKTTVTSADICVGESSCLIKSTDGGKYAETIWIVCPNDHCKKISLDLNLFDYSYDRVEREYIIGNQIRSWKLIPNSTSISFPEYIPKALRNDYEEATSILQLSPKASATLSRRCLEGMIRDFWGVTENSLFKSINAIENKIDPLTWKSIDSIRKVGNIGAHMEKDINLIIDVEPQEASLLIQLIEMLFEEWYIHRYEREQKLNAIVAIAEAKDKERNKK